MKSVNVGICGLGTVGSGTVNVLVRNAEILSARTGCDIRITQIGARRPNPSCDTSEISVVNDIFEVASNPDVDILVELIGGYDTALKLVKEAISNGKHIVTANKALIAEHGNEIFALAREMNIVVAYEAGVAGGIPAIKSLREGLVANRINWLAGIINGTGNFILTEMKDKGSPFADVLKQAQDLGYAEADPTFDVEGIDAAHKLTILASNAFGIPLMFDKTFTEGISKVTPEDLQYAEEFGYRIKHLGIARNTDKGVELRVHPTLIPESHLLASVDGVMNSVLIDGDAVGQTMYYGAGAGSEPTASAVVADIADIARIISAPECAVPPVSLLSAGQDVSVLPIGEIVAASYLRIRAEDHPGVLMKVTEVLGQHGINIDALLQKEARESDGCADIAVLTHHIRENLLMQAVSEIEELEEITSPVVHIRVDHLGG
ncbi:homoserine dehydrogenase [Sansalvadorimonas sp. 2012CJ34-2]|uniref:Homoserine dehydrogenase n=1 Tax=Parendozoicomonas callyspongiae TaxID=2942213 RepID=A0ABT0PFL9_9GAMM|nr:homoserine dehydrogenase [Sansalvadorimonas sp. 2012CJ34-2]MCL6270168.1 homoserine dehydrogenase [Sansalvadorimonas sp. 2012CJ34-2]